MDPQSLKESLFDIELDSIESSTGHLLNCYSSKDFVSTKHLFKTADVLYSKLRPYLKKYYLAKFDGLCSSEFWVLRPGKRITSQFLYSYVQRECFNILANKTCGTKMPRAEWSLIKDSEIFFPSIEEQHKIGASFGDLDCLIDTANSEYIALKKYKEGVTNEWFKKEGSRAELGKLVSSKPSGLLTSHFKENSGDYPVYDASGTQYTKIDFFNNDVNSISIIKYGSGCGRTFITEGPHSVLGTMNEMIPNSNEDLEYIYAYTLSIYFRRICKRYTEIGTTPNLYFSDYSTAKLYYPEKEERGLFVSAFSLLEQVGSIYDMKIKLLYRIKSFLLKNMFM